MSTEAEDETVIAFASKLILARADRAAAAKVTTAYLDGLDPLAASIRAGTIADYVSAASRPVYSPSCGNDHRQFPHPSRLRRHHHRLQGGQLMRRPAESRGIPSDVPTAEVKKVSGQVAYIICPYCGYEHKHERVQPGIEWRAPACALYGLNPKQRHDGYQFTVEARTTFTANK